MSCCLGHQGSFSAGCSRESTVAASEELFAWKRQTAILDLPHDERLCCVLPALYIVIFYLFGLIFPFFCSSIKLFLSHHTVFCVLFSNSPPHPTGGGVSEQHVVLGLGLN